MNAVNLPRWGFVLISMLLLMGGLAMNGVRTKPAVAVVGAYVELHVAECPPGYDGDSLFEDCHENRVSGVTFIAEGPGDERYEVVTDINGVAFFNDFYTAGSLTIIEQFPSGNYSSYEMYCTTTEDQTILLTGSGNGRTAASFDLPQGVIDSGTGVVCDWYSFTAVPGSQAQPFGLGLTRTDWEALHGPGDPTQQVVMYEEGRYALGFSDEVVTFIETEWIAEGGVSAAEAAAKVMILLPHDAELVQRYELHPTPTGPTGVVVERYVSGILASRLGGLPAMWDGSAIAVYQLGVPTSTGEPPVVRISIAAGTEATSL